MRIKKINLYTNKLDLERAFYSDTLGFDLIADEHDFFTIYIGWSELTFTASSKRHAYHYCFLIPSNQLNQSLEWMEQRTDIIDIENGRRIQNFKSWNADSFYFLDASGNIAEFIVRYDLKNSIDIPFQCSNVLGFNEIGLPTSDIEKVNSKLKNLIGTDFWKGDLTRFGTNGNQEGLILLPNYQVKDKWYPTNQKIIPEPFEAIIENQGKEFGIRFHDGKIEEMRPTTFDKS